MMKLGVIFIAVISFALATGCSGMESDGPDALVATVSAQEVAALGDGEMLRLDLGLNEVYTVDFQEAFDMKRVILVSGSQEVSLEEWLAESSKLGIDHRRAVDKQFQLAGSPGNFGTLTPEQISDLETNLVLDDEPESVTYWCAILAYGCHRY